MSVTSNFARIVLCATVVALSSPAFGAEARMTRSSSALDEYDAKMLRSICNRRKNTRNQTVRAAARNLPSSPARSSSQSLRSMPAFFGNILTMLVFFMQFIDADASGLRGFDDDDNVPSWVRHRRSRRNHESGHTTGMEPSSHDEGLWLGVAGGFGFWVLVSLLKGWFQCRDTRPPASQRTINSLTTDNQPVDPLNSTCPSNPMDPVAIEIQEKITENAAV